MENSDKFYFWASSAKGNPLNLIVKAKDKSEAERLVTDYINSCIKTTGAVFTNTRLIDRSDISVISETATFSFDKVLEYGYKINQLESIEDILKEERNIEDSIEMEI